MKEPDTTDIIAFLLCIFLLFAISVATQVYPNPPDIGYTVIDKREDGSPLYIKDNKTGATYYIAANGEKINVEVYG